MTATTSITVRVPLAIRRRPGRKTVVTPVRDGDEAILPTRADPVLVRALARAFRYQRMLDEGRYASISEMAATERVERGCLGTLLRLTLLAPDIVGAILDGRQQPGLSLPRLLEPFPLAWDEQRSVVADDAAAAADAQRLRGPSPRPPRPGRPPCPPPALVRRLLCHGGAT